MQLEISIAAQLSRKRPGTRGVAGASTRLSRKYERLGPSMRNHLDASSLRSAWTKGRLTGSLQSPEQ